jgi:hypothetical protein
MRLTAYLLVLGSMAHGYRRRMVVVLEASLAHTTRAEEARYSSGSVPPRLSSVHGSWDYQRFIRHVGAILIVIVGLYVTTIMNPLFRAGNKQFRFNARSIRYAVSCAVRGSFAAGWTRYVGPALEAALSSFGKVGTMMDGFTLLVFSVILCGMAARFQCYSTTVALISALCGFLLILVGAPLNADRLIYLPAAITSPSWKVEGKRLLLGTGPRRSM